MRCRRRLRKAALAVAAMLAVAAAAGPVAAVETPMGSHNFSAPRYVPNYFSNESAPFQGGGGARPGQPGPVPTFATPAPRGLGGRYAAPSRRYAVHHGRHGAARGRHDAARGAARRHYLAVSAHRHGHAVAAGSLHARGGGAAHHAAAHAGGKRLARAGR